MGKKNILLNPGPVNVTSRVRNALLRDDICHREDEFVNLLEGIRSKLLRVFSIEKDYTVAIFTGCGTAAQEAAIASIMPEDKDMLIICNGVYGERMADAAEIFKIKTIKDEYQWGSPPDINRIKAILDREKNIETVSVIHHETTTGILNEIEDIGKLCKEYGKIFFVDTVSSLGAENVDFYKNNIDVCIGTTNKCLHSFPGISFVIFKKELFNQMKQITPRSGFLDLGNYVDDNFCAKVPFTPSVQIMYAFDEALDELTDEGYDNRVKTYKERAHFLRAGIKDLGLKLLLPEDVCSNSITSVYLPNGFTYKDIHGELKKHGYIIYAGQGELKDKVFRVSNMGDHSMEDYKGFLSALKEIL